MKEKERLSIVSRKSAMQDNKNTFKRAREAERNNASSVSNNSNNHNNTSFNNANICIWRRRNNSKSRTSKIRNRSGKSKRTTRNGRSDS